jgi:hypothetical protein
VDREGPSLHGLGANNCIGSARGGNVTAFIPDPDDIAPSTSSAEGVAVDAAGNIYGEEEGLKALNMYEKK